MIDLSLYPKFQSDVQGTTVSLHPLIVIHSSPTTYYLSQNEETLIVGGVQTHFTSADLKVPSIKESLDLESRRIKINNVTLSFSNYDDFSDKFATETFLNKYVDIYWKSPSCTNLSDCLLVYKAVVSRVDHDYKTVKFILEDKTEAVIHKDVPISLIPPEKAHSDKYVNKRIPMTYGTIKHAPAVLWKDSSNDTDTLKYIHVLTDTYDFTKVGSTVPDSGHNLGYVSESWKSTISVFTGNYMYLPALQTTHADHSPILYQHSLGNDKVRLEQHYTGEFPQNSIAVNEAQVVINRRAVSASLLDYSQEGEDGYTYNYIGATEGVHMEHVENLLSLPKVSYDGHIIDDKETYASVPQNEYDGVIYNEDIEDGWLQLSSFTSGNNDIIETWDTDPFYASTIAEEYGEVSETPSGNRQRLNSIAYYALANEGVELLSMPDSKKLYDLFMLWWQDNVREDGLRVYPYSADYFGEHRMSMSGTSIYFKIALYGDWNAPDAGSDFAYIVTTENAWGEEIGGYTPPDDEPTPVVQLWHLINTYSGRVYGSPDIDIPRYRMLEETDEIINTRSHQTEYGYGGDYGYDTLTEYYHYYNKNWNAHWNGVSHLVWNNSGAWGGHDQQVASPWSNYNISQHHDIYQRQQWMPIPQQEEGFTHDMYNKWGKIYSHITNWWIHLTEPLEFGGYTYDRGSLFTTKHVIARQTGDDNNGGTHNGTHIYNWMIQTAGNKYQPGGAVPDTMGTVSLSDGIPELTDDKRLGVVYSLEDSGASDIKSDSCVTQFWGKFGFIPEGEDIESNTSARLKATWLVADMQDNDEGTLEDVGVGDLQSYQFSSIVGINSLLQLNSNTSYPQVWSDIWSNPEDFNAAIIRYWVSGEQELSASISARFYKLGVKHVGVVENLFEKDFFVSSHGRTLENNTPTNIIKNIINTELEVEPEVGTSYNAAEAYCENYPLAFSITKKVNSKKLIEDIAKNTPLIPYFQSTTSGSALNFAIIKNTYEPEDVKRQIKSSDVIKSSFTRTKVEDVKTIIRVNYRKDYGRDSFKETTLYRSAYDMFGNGDVGSPSRYSKEYLGLDKDNPGDSALEVNSDYIRDISVANKLRDFLVAYKCNQHLILKARLPLTYINLEVSDIISFDSLIQGKLAFGDDYTQPITRNGQLIYPYFMITDINKSVKSVDITCTQMHKLTPTDGIIYAASGDVNMSGGAPDIDDLDVMDNYIMGGDKYFTEGQLKNGDVNNDYLVNEVDSSLLSDIIFGVEEEIDEEEIAVNMYDGYNHHNPGGSEWEGEGDNPGAFTVLGNSTVQFVGNGMRVGGGTPTVFFPWAFPLCVPGNTYEITLTVSGFIGEETLHAVSVTTQDIYADIYTMGITDFDNSNDLLGNGTLSFEWTCEYEGHTPILCATSVVRNAIIVCNIDLISEGVIEEDEIEEEEGLINLELGSADHELAGVFEIAENPPYENNLRWTGHDDPDNENSYASTFSGFTQLIPGELYMLIVTVSELEWNGVNDGFIAIKDSSPAWVESIMAFSAANFDDEVGEDGEWADMTVFVATEENLQIGIHNNVNSALFRLSLIQL